MDVSLAPDTLWNGREREEGKVKSVHYKRGVGWGGVGEKQGR